MKSKYSISANFKIAYLLQLAEISVGGQNFQLSSSVLQLGTLLIFDMAYALVMES